MAFWRLIDLGRGTEVTGSHDSKSNSIERLSNFVDIKLWWISHFVRFALRILVPKRENSSMLGASSNG